MTDNDRRSTERFTKTVTHYLKYRPGYPKAVVQTLINDCGLTANKIIADIGSGTGFLAELFLDAGNLVYGVEPNDEMREGGEIYLQRYKNFISKKGQAEHTGLTSESIDIITVGTAFHWFQQEQTKQEFQRILKSPGWVLLVWNVRSAVQPLMQEYEKLIIQYGKDYLHSKAEAFDQTAVASFFAPFPMKKASFNNRQLFDWEGFQGRLFSTSYSLQKGEPGFLEMLADLKRIFDRYQQQGKVIFEYETKLYYGRLR